MKKKYIVLSVGIKKTGEPYSVCYPVFETKNGGYVSFDTKIWLDRVEEVGKIIEFEMSEL